MIFLKVNPCIYSKRLADYKDVEKKDFLWEQQARLMVVAAQELKVWYDSMRTRMGKLKKSVVVSGQSADVFTPTKAWIWNHFQFLNEHIATVTRHNVASFKSGVESREQEQQRLQSSATLDAPLPDSEPPRSSTPALVISTTSSVPQSESSAVFNLLKAFVQDQTCRGASFGMMVDRILDELPTELRRVTESRLLSMLHEAQAEGDKRCQSLLSPPAKRQQAPHQPQQPPHSMTRFSNPSESRQWQPPPAEWSTAPCPAPRTCGTRRTGNGYRSTSPTTVQPGHSPLRRPCKIYHSTV